jgi:RecJ-like exonuclease
MKCMACNGKGRIIRVSENKEVPCRLCNGTGKERLNPEDYNAFKLFNKAYSFLTLSQKIKVIKEINKGSE